MTSRSSMSILSSVLLKRLGLNIHESSFDDLAVRAGKAAAAFGFTETELFVQWLLSNIPDKKETERLSVFFTTGESYFQREPISFDFLEKQFLPGLIAGRRNCCKSLRIWSAGCSTGEEPYSIAILLRSVLPDFNNWMIKILASDINPHFLEKARQGIYAPWSLRKCNEAYINRNFKKIPGDLFQVKDEIRQMVTFSNFNLAQDDMQMGQDYNAYFDVIFCRNVLIYFNSDGIREASAKLFKLLSDGGILLLSPVEMTNLISSEFSKQFYQGYTFYSRPQPSLFHGNNKKKISISGSDISSETPITQWTDISQTNI
jgi:chemotaxis protein methyltransferase CheR